MWYRGIDDKKQYYYYSKSMLVKYTIPVEVHYGYLHNYKVQLY